jgi:uncharacterized protein with NRDE domain
VCLILFSYQNHPKYSLILISNRDEFYNRPTDPIHFWKNDSNLLAGKDLKDGGTWLGVHRNGRFAAITNYRDFINMKEVAPSRGHLVSNYLSGEQSPLEYLQGLEKDAKQYNGFNLLVGDQLNLFYFSNESTGITQVQAGIHGLSNHLLNTSWQKVEKGKEGLENLITQNFSENDFFELLSGREKAPDEILPDTGADIELERELSSLFISIPDHGYGTRSSSILLIEHTGKMKVIERIWGRPNQKEGIQHFEVSPSK